MGRGCFARKKRTVSICDVIVSASDSAARAAVKRTVSYLGESILGVLVVCKGTAGLTWIVLRHPLHASHFDAEASIATKP